MAAAPLHSEVTVQQRSLVAADGTKLFLLDWLIPPDQSARGGIVLMHGLGEHCGRYGHVAEFFNQQGWSVRAYDHRGHGRSGGPRGDVPNEHALLDDAELVIADFSRENSAQWSGAPLLFGHSMGGLFAARFAGAARLPLRGLILSSPVLTLKLTAFQSMLARVMRRIAPGFAVSNGLKAEFLSHDLALVEAYRVDPYGQGKISARLLQSMIASIEIAQRSAGALRIPVLMLVAGDDRLVDAAGSDAFFARLDPANAVMQRYQGMYHEIFNEIDKQRVFADVAAWLALPGR